MSKLYAKLNSAYDREMTAFLTELNPKLRPARGALMKQYGKYLVKENESADPTVRELKKLCNAKTKVCEKALRNAGGDLRGALRELIAAGEVTQYGLDPDAATVEEYAMTLVKEMLDKQSALKPEGQKVFGITRKHLEEYRRQLAGTMPLDRDILTMAESIRQRHLTEAHPERHEVKKPETVNGGIFGRLTRSSGWEGEMMLKSWKGYQSRGGAYTSQDSGRPSAGKVKLSVETGGRGSPPSKEQVEAFRYLQKHEKQVAEAILRRTLDEYQKRRKQWEVEDDVKMPPVKKAEEFRKMIGLGMVHVLNHAKGGVAYVGFQFGCTWDEEHGMGVMMHKQRVVRWGEADMSFLEWVATRDGGKEIKER